MEDSDRRTRETDEASQWWIRLGPGPTGEVSESEREQFTRWLRKSPVHIAEFLHVAHVHDALGRFKLWQEVSIDLSDEKKSVTLLGPSPTQRRRAGERSGERKAYAVAAAIVIALTMALLLPKFRGHVVATDIAERRELMLSDGSIVKLEPETALRVRFNDRERQVTLHRGRALFRVAKEPGRPFRVEAERTVVRAVGTAFGVERKRQGIVVTVSEGKVAVDSAPDARRPAVGNGVDRLSLDDVSPAQVFLSAGQQVTVQNSGLQNPVKNVNTARALAWTKGYLVFDSTPLSEVVVEFNRYNRLQMRVTDLQLASRPISGVFAASDPETLIAFVRAGARAEIIRESRQILIEPGKPD